jgi:molecular chaperone GrpE
MSDKPEDSALPEKADEVGEDKDAKAAADAAADIAAEFQADEGAEEAEEEVEEHDPLAEAQAEVADLKDKLLRAMAEMENLRRRSEKEKTELGKYAVTNFARDMLSVADNMDRALSAADPDGSEGGEEALTQLLDGVRLTQKDLLHQFEKHGIREINPIGEKLDPNWHQAMVQLDDPEAPAGTIVQVMQVGYAIQDRLLRAAMVGVAKGGGNGGAGGGGGKGANVDTTA